MPPMYDWCCKECGKEAVVIRTFKEYENPPGTSPDDSAVTTTDGVEDSCKHKWEREIGGKQTVIKSANWGGGKGSW